MDHLKIAATDRSPDVDFDFDAGIFSLKGESYPEDASTVFGPIFAALDRFFSGGEGRALRFDFDLIYFNSSSAKALMNMFQMMENAAGCGTTVVVNWHYAADDETMKEFGEDFSEDLENVTFNLVTTSTAP